MPQKQAPQLTALIITYNEIRNIRRCIEAIDFVTEIVVVDSYSTDGTYEYLREHPKVRVLQRDFRNFTDQKNFALGQAQGDWVLFIDADEVVGPDLRLEILQTLQEDEAQIDAYWFYRQFMFGERLLQFSGWQTDKNIRLFRRSSARYSKARLVHERLEVQGQTRKLKSRLTHYCYTDFPSYKRKMILYGRLKAAEAFHAGKRFSWARQILKPCWRFGYNYLLRLGILDGWKGMVICYLGALEDIERYRYLRKLESADRLVEQPGLRVAPAPMEA